MSRIDEIDYKGQFGAMIRRIPVFQQGAVCLTRVGPESSETAKEIIARKDLERRAGLGAHKNEFWWGIGEKGTARSIQTLISQHGCNTVLFAATKDRSPRTRDPQLTHSSGGNTVCWAATYSKTYPNTCSSPLLP